MAKLIFNKANWSGEEITVNVNERKKEFSLFGYRFKIRQAGCRDVYKVLGDQWSEPLMKVFKIKDRYITTSYAERESDNIFIAVIQSLCNTI